MDHYLGLIIGIIIGLVIYHLITNINLIYCPSQNQIIDKLLRQTSRWLTASLQDTSPLISMLHGMYGYGYFMALQDITNPSELGKYVDIQQYTIKLNGAMDAATKKVVKVCPKYGTELDRYFANMAGDV